jgi:hypothetical protein
VTAPVSAPAAADPRISSTVRRVETSLRDAVARLHPEVSPADVRAARHTIDEAERSLGSLARDPWDAASLPLRQAREILSSHLLAAAACEGADVAPPVTARVLRRGADSARRVLASRAASMGAESQD